MNTIYQSGRKVVETLINDSNYIDIVLVYDIDQTPYAGLFVKRGEYP